MLNKCPRCQNDLKKSNNKNYDFECLKCDEDFYNIEIKAGVPEFEE